jgi:hypothetical protein
MHRANKGVGSPVERLVLMAETAVKVARTARKNRASLAGINFYGEKLAKLRTDATVVFGELADPSVGDVSAVAEMMQLTFASETDAKKRVLAVRELTHELRTKKWRVAPSENVTDSIFPLNLLTKTRRGYLIAIGREMNGCFESGWYNACAVMMRRLLETSIIEAFEAHHLEGQIKNPQGEFFQLTALIATALAETAWNLSRNTKQALPNLRDIGHTSAHARRFTAQKSDIERVQPHCRIALEEFLHLAGHL